MRPRSLLLLAALLAACGAGDSTDRDTPTEATSSEATPTNTEGPTPSVAATPTPTAPGGDPSVPFTLAGAGCPMAHCDPRMSDAALMPAPVGSASVLWHDRDAAGSNYGLGCASNGEIAACSMGGNGRGGPYLVVYDAQGNRLWEADEPDIFSFTSAPLIGEDGSVIQADSRAVYHYSPTGQLLRRIPHAVGLPISPVPGEGDVLFLAGIGGPFAAVSLEREAVLGVLDPRGTYLGQEGHFRTRNTPTVKGNRAYISTEFVADGAATIEGGPARLYAVDLTAEGTLKVAWFFEFGARSGASPLRIGDRIYFDGDRMEPGGSLDPRVFCVEDRGESAALLWTRPMPGPGFASSSQDPRGGLLAFAFDSGLVKRLDEDTGEILTIYDIAGLVGPGFTPFSAMTVTEGPGGSPVLLLNAATANASRSTAIALDLDSGRLLWAVPFGKGAAQWSAAQWPVALGEGGSPVIVVATAANGILGIGVPWFGEGIAPKPL